MVRQWTEPLVQRLVKGHGGKSPEAIIKRYADDLREQGRQLKLPIDVEGIASLLGIRVRTQEVPFMGRIFVEPSGQLVMDLNRDDIRPRRRFTCAHEIIHTAFPGFKKEARYRSDDHTGLYDVRRTEEEFLCDTGASWLLMPQELVADRYSATSGLAAVEQLAEEAHVSLEAAGNRLVSLAEGPVVFLVLETAHKPADRAALRKGQPVPKRLRVKYVRSTKLDVYVPRFKSADDRSVFAHATKSVGSIAGSGTLPGVHSRHGVFQIEAKAYPISAGQVQRVLAIAHPTI
jgi:IrrE N-terminal-like domain